MAKTKKRKMKKKYIGVTATSLLLLLIIASPSCKKNLLDEKSLSNPSVDQVLSTQAGFQNYLTALHVAARNECFETDGVNTGNAMIGGTDEAIVGDPTLTQFKDYNTTLTPTFAGVTFFWNWAYSEMISKANTVITFAERSNPAMWTSEAQRNAVIAEAKFFRAYSYNLLANLYGGVPIVDTVYAIPRVDFTRATRTQVLDFARQDLVYASQWLPPTVVKAQEGHIVKAAADHLLSEVYISLGNYDSAIASATRVIGSGLYHLMTTRFGSAAASPGDPYSDLFLDNNQNRSSGNMESIYVWQFEDVTPGGKPGAGGNDLLRAWGPRYWSLNDPAGKPGFIVSDSMGRGVAWLRLTDLVFFGVWGNDFNTDMRNSFYNIRRQYVYNNPASAYFGKVVEPRTVANDTIVNIFPTIRKIEGKVGKTTDNTLGRTFKDVMVYRLSETYLLRAEAYLDKADLQHAADDINVVRNRAHATPVAPANVNLDYILDERVRELMLEEPRRRTLARLGVLVARTKKYTIDAGTRSTIQEKHQWYPIPQSAIDANLGAVLQQNPGY
jgi:hypothetical protein